MGFLPSNIEVNLKESAKSIIFKSSKDLSSPILKELKIKIVNPQPRAEHSVQDSLNDKVNSWRKVMGKGKTKLHEYETRLPYPAKVKKDQQEEQYNKIP